jgi:hypothetical protein
MKDKSKMATDDEIEAEVLKTRMDPDEWEEMAVVPPSQAPRPEWALRAKHLQLAAKFHVLSVLHLFGAEANLALSQPDNVDIIVVNRAGTVLTIDVKTVTRTNEWIVDPFVTRKHHFVVFVDLTEFEQNPTRTPSVYVVSSERLRDHVTRQHLDRVSIDQLNQSLKIQDAWQPLLAEAAA